MSTPNNGRHPDGTAGSRAEWATSLAGDVRRLDPRQAAALVQIYSRRATFDEAAHALGVTVDEFVATLSDALRSLGRLISTPGPTVV